MLSTFSNFPLLSLAIWCPIAFGVFVLALGRQGNSNQVRVISLIGSLASFLVTIPLVLKFDNTAHGLQFVEKSPWINTFKVFYSLGLDGISLWMVPLTAFITVIVVIAG